MKQNIKHLTIVGLSILCLSLLPLSTHAQKKKTLGFAPPQKHAAKKGDKERSAKRDAKATVKRIQSPNTEPDTSVLSQNVLRDTMPSVQRSMATQDAEALVEQCDYSTLLLDEVVFTSIYMLGGPSNSTLMVEVRQTNTNILGLAASATGPFGPFSETITIPLTTDASGDGRTEDFYIKGLAVGQSIVTGYLSDGTTTTTSLYMTVIECPCPYIPTLP